MLTHLLVRHSPRTLIAHCPGCIYRNLSTELSQALRPFYFVVHPDLFGQHPKQRNVNENSLKQLNAHMESLYERKFDVLREKKILQFYIRTNSAVSRDIFKMVEITLDERLQDPKKLIEKLLELCDLPTDDVKNIRPTSSYSPKESVKPPTASGNASAFRGGQDYNYGSEFYEFQSNFYQAKEEQKKTINTFMKENANLAKTRARELDGLKSEIMKLQKSVIERLELEDVRFDCGWNFEYYRGCLKSLERLADMHEEQMSILKGRILVFAPFTGVSLEGHIMLFTGDVLKNWMDFIRHIPKHDKSLKVVPLYEKTLSQVLRNIKIGRRRFMPKQQAKHYASHLTKVTTTLNDYLTTSKYPKSWPDSLNEYEIVIESESGPLMVNPTGQLIAPSTCPAFMLIDFITTNLEMAKERMITYKEQRLIEHELMVRCIKQLRLHSLTKDDSVTPDKMIETLKKLLRCDANYFENVDLHVTNYYSVRLDGIVCIPWDLEFS